MQKKNCGGNSNEAPNKEETMNFWCKIWAEEGVLNEKVSWLSEMVFREWGLPEWMVTGRTVLIKKEPTKGTVASNYRPIAYLPLCGCCSPEYLQGNSMITRTPLASFRSNRRVVEGSLEKPKINSWSTRLNRRKPKHRKRYLSMALRYGSPSIYFKGYESH